MRFRLVLSLAVAALVLTASAACTPDPAPTPTPTGFASEEEAFAAAEQTYREYVDALNQVDLSDPDTFDNLFEWTTDGANAADRKGFSGMHADGLVVQGQTRVALVSPLRAEGTNFSMVQLATCLDVSAVSVVDADGKSAVEPDRDNLQAYLITLRAEPDSETGLRISDFNGREGEPSCEG